MKIQEIRTAIINMSHEEYCEVKNALELLDTFISLCGDVTGIKDFHFEDAYDLIEDSTLVNITDAQIP